MIQHDPNINPYSIPLGKRAECLCLVQEQSAALASGGEVIIDFPGRVDAVLALSGEADTNTVQAVFGALFAQALGSLDGEEGPQEEVTCTFGFDGLHGPVRASLRLALDAAE